MTAFALAVWSLAAVAGRGQGGGMAALFLFASMLCAGVSLWRLGMEKYRELEK